MRVIVHVDYLMFLIVLINRRGYSMALHHFHLIILVQKTKKIDNKKKKLSLVYTFRFAD